MGHSTASGRTRSDSAAFVPHELDIPRGVTPAQRKVLDRLKEQIDLARTNDFESFHEKYYHTTVEWVRYRWRSDPAGAERTIQTKREYYEQLRSGEALINASGPTIHKLERLGLIKILHDSTGTGRYSHDRIKLLNY